MSLTDNQPSHLHLSFHHPKRQKWTDSLSYTASSCGEDDQSLSSSILPNSPAPSSVDGDDLTTSSSVRKVGNYIILYPISANSLSLAAYKSVNVRTRQTCICKIVPVARYHDVLEPYLRAGYHENLNEIQEIILAETEAYIFFPEHHGDLHTYIRNARRLKEPEAAQLFRQIAAALCHCHENGIIVRDLKLRKFVFKDPERTQLMLEGFEDSILLPSTANEDGAEPGSCDDSLTDKHGCPVYVSPEILQNTTHYSGRLADLWSLGVILYTMLVGCYPFHDPSIPVLFALIRAGRYAIPPPISPRARCLIRNLLRMKPEDRLSAADVLTHPWLEQCESKFDRYGRAAELREKEQRVPCGMLDDETVTWKKN